MINQGPGALALSSPRAVTNDQGMPSQWIVKDRSSIAQDPQLACSIIEPMIKSRDAGPEKGRLLDFSIEELVIAGFHVKQPS